VQITTGVNDICPGWSADGTELVFERNFSQIYRVAATAGAVPVFVVDGRYPTWSPVGNEIAYVEGQGAGHEQIFRINKSGSLATRVQVAVTATRDLLPSWAQ
jgi:Tol biopolymer transport system component